MSQNLSKISIIIFGYMSKSPRSKSPKLFFMPRRTKLIELISKLIATNYENGLEVTPIICRQSFCILLQVAFLKCSSSEVNF